MENQSENNRKFMPHPDLKLMGQVLEVLRYYQYTYRTKKNYCQWILRYIYYVGGKKHPSSELFLFYLVNILISPYWNPEPSSRKT